MTVAFGAALVVPAVALIVHGPDKPETWATAAAGLAVITSVISAWSSRRVVELQEDAQKPNPYPAFDFTSRYCLVLLRVKNTGGTPAHNVSLEWNTELKDHKGKTIGFTKTGERPAISVLLPGESISQIIGPTSQFFKAHPDEEYTGIIAFQDSSRHRCRRTFRLDGRSHSGSYDEEATRTLYELQKIPKQLDAITKVVEKLAPNHSW
ncbi:MAG: hypothetical protein IPM60_11670 [Rhodospirillales bacterium]|nr:hypothetical protein [Rhodospirillales bacterium]